MLPGGTPASLRLRRDFSGASAPLLFACLAGNGSSIGGPLTESGSSAKNDIDTMELVAMGMGGFLTLINATPYEWDLIYHHSFCMNGWDSAFPTSIGPGGAERIYVEFDTWEVFDDTQDAAEAIYSFGPSSSPFSFQVQARGNSGANVFDPHLQIQFDNFQTPGNPRGSILNLGWNHGYPHAVATSGAFGQPLNLWGNGSVTFILSMDAAGNLHSSNPPGATWMSDNLGTLGGRTLRQLCMPGTHDSGMSQIGSCTEFGDAFNTRTQSQGIYGQLVEGARYFDIRPVISDGVFVTGHYSFLGSILKSQGCNGQSIAGVIDDINRFTGQVLGGRQERGLIILSLSADMNTDLGEGNYRSLTQEEWNRLLGELQQINHLYVQSDPHSIASMAWASGTVTVTTSGPHGFDVATPNVIIAGVAPDDYNGAFPCTITSSTTFTYALASNPGTVATEGTDQPVVDLSQLTLNDYVLSVPFGGAAVVVIVDPSDPSLPNKVLGTTYFGQGFYYPSNLPLSGTYADKDDVGSMAQDQIGKLQAQRTSQDDKMFQFAWFLTQQQSDVVGDVSRSILSLANWANPWVGINLWPNLRMNCFPNILMTDDIDFIYYWTDGENDHATNVNSCPTTALAIAINDFTAPDPAPVKKLNTFHDASGKVTVSVFSRQSSWPRQIFTDFGVTVDRDMVCVGGGAIGDDNPGGLLTASYPNEDLSGWLVSSKDHINVDRYRLTAFAIGLKIDGMTRPQLMDSINVQFADSATGEHPEAAVSVLNEYVLISGGFRVNYQAVGNLGTASFPDGAITWKARSKDHIDASSAIIRVYAIGLSQHLPVGSVTVQIEQQEFARAEHPQATANLGQGFRDYRVEEPR